MAKNDIAKGSASKGSATMRSTTMRSTTKSDTAKSRKGTVEAGDGTVTVRLVKGLRGTKSIHRLSVKALGLGKLNSTRVLKDSPQVRGLINTVHYLVRVEE